MGSQATGQYAQRNTTWAESWILIHFNCKSSLTVQFECWGGDEVKRQCILNLCSFRAFHAAIVPLLDIVHVRPVAVTGSILYFYSVLSVTSWVN